MEKFDKNHPRFCAQYVKKIGVAKEEKIGWCNVIKFENKFYIYQQFNKTYQPGDKVFIAKKIPKPGNQWTIHEIILAEDFWFYEFFATRTQKEQITTSYVPIVKNYFGKKTYIIKQVSLEYIKRKFGVK